MQFYAALAGSALFLFWASGGSSVVFWLIICAAGTLGGHAAFRHPVEETILAQNTIAEAAGLADNTFSSAFGSEV